MFACTLGYSLILKRKLLIDVIMLGGLYTLRIFGGLAATNAHQTQWLLMFSLFLFLSLAIVKRCSELVQSRQSGKTGARAAATGLKIWTYFYRLARRRATVPFVVTLYLSSPEMAALYTHPNRLWLACPLLLYWISRVLIMSNRGELHDDPIIFALTDRISWVTGACLACCNCAFEPHRGGCGEKFTGSAFDLSSPLLYTCARLLTAGPALRSAEGAERRASVGKFDAFNEKSAAAFSVSGFLP